MININAKVTGMDKTIRNMKIYSREMDIGIQQAMQQVVDYIVDRAQSSVPVDSGDLQRSITGVVRKITRDTYMGRVEAAEEYAAMIEFGTSTRPATPYLIPAVQYGLDRMAEEMKKAHKRAVSRTQII